MNHNEMSVNLDKIDEPRHLIISVLTKKVGGNPIKLQEMYLLVLQINRDIIKKNICLSIVYIC